MIRDALPADASALVRIYNHFIRETVVTFEEVEITAADMAGRMAEVAAAQLPWLVWDEAGRILGYCYAAKWKARSAYRFSVEVTVYLDHAATGRGLGKLLYTALLAELRPRKVHAVIGGVALPNAASVALHESLGFKPVAHFKETGFKFGRWIDVGYWELVLGS